MGKNLTLKELKAQSKGLDFDKVVSDLKKALMKDYTIEEACFVAGIHKDTYYRWLKISDEFSGLMEKAKSYIARMAKRNIAEKVEERDIDISKWWLEHRAGDLYSTKQKVENDVKVNIDKERKDLDELYQKIDEKLDKDATTKEDNGEASGNS